MNLKTDSVALFATRLSSKIITLVSIMYLSRFLLLESYGYFRQWLLVVHLLTAIFSFGFPASISYYLPRSSSGNEEKTWLSNILFSTGIFVILIFLLGPFLGNKISHFFSNPLIKSHKYLLSLTIALSISENFFPNYFVVKRERLKLAVFTLLPNLLWLILLITCCYFSFDLKILLFAFLSRPLSSCIIGFYKNRDIFSIRLLELAKIKDIVKFSVPLGLSTLVGTIMIYTDKFVVSSMLSSAEFAIFVNGAYEIPIIGLIGGSLFTVLIPRLSEKFQNLCYDEIRTYWIRAGKTLIPLIVSISCTLVFFSKSYVVFLFSDRYLAAVPVFAIYQSLGVIRIYVFSTIFISSGNTRLYFINTCISAILNIFLDIMLVHLYGYIGASIATAICTVFLVILQVFQCKSITQSKTISGIFPLRSLIIGVICSCLLNSFCLYFSIALNSNLVLSLLISMICFTASFLILSKLISTELLDLGKHLLGNLFKIRAELN